MRSLIATMITPACAAIFLATFALGCRDKSPADSGADKPEPNAVAVSDTPAPTPAQAPATGGTAAIVNGVEIAESQVEELIRPQLDSLAGRTKYLPPNVIKQYADQFRAEALKQLIRAELLDQKIHQANVKITDEEVMSQMEQIATAQKVSLDRFIKALEQQGHNLDQMKQDLRQRLARNKYMETQWAGKVEATEEEARKYYDENREQFKTPEQIRASHVLIVPQAGGDPNEAMAKAKSKAEDLLKRIKGGADFAEIAKEYSACPSAPNGGDLGFFPRGKATPEFDKAAFELKVGEISNVVETEYGLHIIKVTDHKDPADIAFEPVKEGIIEQLTQQKQSAFADAYLDKLQAEAKVVYPASM